MNKVLKEWISKLFKRPPPIEYSKLIRIGIAGEDGVVYWFYPKKDV